MQKSNSQYDSFLFWRQPIPALDLSELEVMEGKAANGKDRTKSFQEEENSSFICDSSLQVEYSSFNYWRDPIARIDSLMGDLNLLLL
ncbi:hypothetical protein NHX12_023418 [Muraenolepis orangiensis]|uniref:Protein AF1q n=1 Tax=Muraenolepis orangiensis TaxID=630683 RepID=A0A9Q0IS46_9TELE|nr:hypothetical protein NHX12_023418 [Muraenolepis orangiensis]